MAVKKRKPVIKIVKQESKRLCLNIGCGSELKESDKISNWVNYDKNPCCKQVEALNLEDAYFPLESNSVDYIYANHVMEHIDNFIPLMNECHRVLKPKGQLEIRVPLCTSDLAFQDPTHVRFFAETSFEYFCERCSLYQGYGKSYGIKGFSNYKRQVNGWQLFVVMDK